MKATTAQKIEQANKSYQRVINGSSKNDTVVIQAFLDRGIIATPRIDVFKYNDWLYVSDPANGKQKRQVRKGEKSVRVRTMYEEVKNGVKTGKLKPATAKLFHISQTDPVEAPITKADLEDLKTDPDKPIRIEWDKVITVDDGRKAEFTEIQPGISIMVT